MGRKPVVGIFSREDQRCYEWLIAFLLDSSLVNDVRPVNIPTADLIHEVHQCSFAILYHSKNRGRLNITNVVDSLYNEELQTLSLVLGKENVIVVTDDLENTSSNEKARILEEQPSIGEYARDLFLFSSTSNPLLDKRHSPNSQENLQEIKHILKDRKGSFPSIDFGEISARRLLLVMLVLLLLLFLILIIILAVNRKYQRTSPIMNINATTAATATT